MQDIVWGKPEQVLFDVNTFNSIYCKNRHMHTQKNYCQVPLPVTVFSVLLMLFWNRPSLCPVVGEL